MYRAAIICFMLAGCQHVGRPTTVVDSGQPTIDPCPASAAAALEPEPMNPLTGPEQDLAMSGVIQVLPEAQAIAKIEHDEVTYPGWARRGWKRLGQIQDWCKNRQP